MPGRISPAPPPANHTQPGGAFAHYREALWASRIAVLLSVAACALSFLGAILSVISLFYAMR